jgi:hypothetical protein
MFFFECFLDLFARRRAFWYPQVEHRLQVFEIGAGLSPRIHVENARVHDHVHPSDFSGDVVHVLLLASILFPRVYAGVRRELQSLVSREH